jgi:hypothetical protein
MISSDFLLEALESGKLQSVFDCGTAAAITYIYEIEMDGRLYKIDSDSYAKVEVIRSSLFGIRFNEKEDLHSWNTIF